MERSGLCDDEDGGLIGGASLKAPDFVEIVNAPNPQRDSEKRRSARARLRFGKRRRDSRLL